MSAQLKATHDVQGPPKEGALDAAALGNLGHVNGARLPEDQDAQGVEGSVPSVHHGGVVSVPLEAPWWQVLDILKRHSAHSHTLPTPTHLHPLAAEPALLHVKLHPVDEVAAALVHPEVDDHDSVEAPGLPLHLRTGSSRMSSVATVSFMLGKVREEGQDTLRGAWGAWGR